ncbi:MAG: glutamine-hydrolyzing carbamoyl-phosphate synthase small subunit, partial [Pseudomonadota bacterium]
MPALDRPTGILVLRDGTIFRGQGLGRTGNAVGEVCFNTAMTGYQEILTDTSYAGQIITFTFPHIGNVGVNDEDLEVVDAANTSGVRGCVMRADVTEPANYRARGRLQAWLDARGIVGITGVDTRALVRRIRDGGMVDGLIAHAPDGNFDLDALRAALNGFAGIEGADLATPVSTPAQFTWSAGGWRWSDGFRQVGTGDLHVVAIDYGLKTNILRQLIEVGATITVVPAATGAETIMALQPDGIFLSNGPGDPAATGETALPVIGALLDTGVPMFGICLGHQMLSLAIGASTAKMHQGHHGANHPVHDFTTGKVEITSMNHGFAVDGDTLPANAEVTHTSLFDGTNCGMRLKDRPVFSVQHHPEASPGPQD